ncbi:MAG TPA: 2-hydroxyhepta-2,4-diene-1,7-dioate isomerase, partial [Verrucomicrobiota bacterium]|nr:2-hydroxyhepta-2,4-diene-1,7-dioate isomerase [Verrucomicrobiota bacterium]
MLDAQGQLRDLSPLIPDITPATLSPAALAALASIDPATLPA